MGKTTSEKIHVWKLTPEEVDKFMDPERPVNKLLRKIKKFQESSRKVNFSVV